METNDQPCFGRDADDINDPRREELLEGIRRKYASCFDNNIRTEPRHNIKCKIEIEKEIKPPYIYRAPQIYHGQIKEKLTELEQAGVIRRSNSKYKMPITCVQKANGKLRLCVDFRSLNQAIRKDAYILPRIEDIRRGIKGKVFSTIDLKEGFNQVPMTEDSIQYTAMATPFGVYEYTRMPFGICIAPSVFQRLMDSILEGLEKVFGYIDDILLYTDTTDEHINLLEATLNRLAEAGLQVNTEKSKFLKRRVKYLGFTFSDEGNSAPEGHYPKITDAVKPTTRKEILQFMGRILYYKSHIPDLAKIAAPLYDLTSTKRKFEWTEKHDEAFNKLKQAWNSKLTLVPFDNSKEITIETDASSEAIGAALLQDKKPVEFYSYKLLPRERNYSAHEREALAIVKALRNWRHLLLGRKFTVFSDHKPLVWWLYKKTSEQQARQMVNRSSGIRL